jgi:hypothetical protein
MAKQKQSASPKQPPHTKRPQKKRKKAAGREPLNTECVVSYVDALGFRERLNDMSTAIPVLKSFVQAFTQFSRKDDEPNEGAEVIVLSDGIVRARPLTDYAPFFWELLALLHCTMDVIAHGYVVRGAVTLGTLYYDDSERILVSPALLRAYELETNVARYPRIVADPRLISAMWTNDKLREPTHSAVDEWEHASKLLRRADDGLFFLDYLQGSQTEFDDPLSSYPQFLSRHREIILNGLKSDRVNVLEKYRWLENYHNNAIIELLDPSLREYLITPEMPWAK